MVNQALDEAKFWARTAFGLLALAIVGGAVLTKVKMDPAAVGSFFASVIGFVGLMILQARLAVQAANKVDSVKDTVVVKADEVKDAIGSVDRHVGEIQLTGVSNAMMQSQLGLALKAHAIVAARLAALEPTNENKLAAARAAQTLRDHEALNPPLPTAPTGDGHGSGKELVG